MTTEQIVRRYWMAKVYGNPGGMSESTLDTDKRSSGKTIRELLEKHVIERLDSKEGPPLYRCTALALTVDSVKPDLAALRKINEITDSYDLTQVVGVNPGNLTTGNLRYIAEHLTDYRHADRWGKGEDDGGHREFICDQAFMDAVKARALTLRLESATNTNLPWGLVTAGVLTEKESELFTPHEASPFGGSGIRFEKDPDNWGENAKESLETCRKQIRLYQDKLALLEEAQAKIEALGGWEKFTQDYRERIAKAIEKEAETKKAG
jgi:hypothetical protein